ncbi:AMP-binding protein [Arhodomonas sp. AD133]|uniref:AMP-binding protein n=1 Tax=Arhodomonas sp. AD133 TaxID=3415009 RepID=UPI003EB9101E
MRSSGNAENIWRAARRRLDGLPGGGINIAHEAADRHVRAGDGARVAVRYIEPRGRVSEWTYADLAERSACTAAALANLGVVPGDRVAWLGGRRPELFAMLLGCVRMRAVFCPLFTAFGPEPLAARLALARPRVVVTTASLFGRRFTALDPADYGIERILILDDATVRDKGCASYPELLEQVTAASPVPPTADDDPALLHFTSGTTGTPKGVEHVHEAVVAQHHSASVALDLQPGDIFWCTADPGWVTGIAYGVIAPLAVGATVIVDGGEFDPVRWMDILEHQRVAVWYIAPTALRMLRRCGTPLWQGRDLSHLRVAASVGEPLDRACADWAEDALGRRIRDTWWQTETGSIMIASLPESQCPPGAMGKALPGVEAEVVARDADGGLTRVTAAGEPGELALRAQWPSMFRGYLNDPERYAASFRNGCYLTGDMVKRDADGWLTFVGRGDDLIKTAGHLVGPAEVEAALRGHPAVVDVAVVGLPDPMTGERVHAYVVVDEGIRADTTLSRALIAHARRRLGPAVAPRTVEFRATLPYTRSGKIARRVLRAQSTGDDPGDLSTLLDAQAGQPETGEAS